MHSVLMCMCTVCMFSTGIPMDVVSLHVCTVHVVQYICMYMTYVVFACQTHVLYIQMYVSPCLCTYMQLFLSTYSCMYISCNCSLCTCGLPVPISCVMHCWLSTLYRTGLIKDLLLCSGYRDSSSLRPS